MSREGYCFITWPKKRTIRFSVHLFRTMHELVDEAMVMKTILNVPQPGYHTIATLSPSSPPAHLHTQPHIPLKFPAKYLALHPLDKVSPPPSPTLPTLLPHVAYEPWTDVRKREDVQAVISRHNVSFPFGLLPPTFARQIRQHYYAAISYVDDQLGRVIAALNQSAFANNTIVVIFGDHGWQLGERAEWAKYSTCETAARIPLIISLPPSLTRHPHTPTTHSSSPDHPSPAHTHPHPSPRTSRRSSALVEAVDIGPTLIDLAGSVWCFLIIFKF